MTPDVLARLHARAFVAQRPWSESEFAALLGSPLVFVVGTEHAFALGRVILDEVELLTLATDPDKRRAGLGRATLHAFEHAAHARGATRAFLEVAANNLPALALYDGSGYQTTGRRPGYYQTTDGQSVDAVLMSRTLP